MFKTKEWYFRELKITYYYYYIMFMFMFLFYAHSDINILI